MPFFGSEDLSKIIKYVAYGITLSIIVALKNLKKKVDFYFGNPACGF